MSERVLILGYKGTLGQALTSDLNSRGYDVAGWDREDVDVTTPEVGKKIKDLAPEIIINVTADNSVDKIETEEEEKKLAHLLNGKTPGNLAKIAKDVDAIFIHYSTDYVFKGDKKDGYAEFDKPEPISVYGETKYEGEREVVQNGEKYYLIRLSRLFGKKGISEGSKRTFVDIMLGEIDKEELTVKDEEVSSPTYAPDLAEFTRKLIEDKAPWGIYHGTNSGSCTWYGWAAEIFKDLDRGPKKMIRGKASDYHNPAAHPQYSILLNTKRPQQRSWQEALKEFLISK